MHRPCFLIGFPGSGKSYWGRRLAARTGLPLIDLDAFIEQQTGWSVAELFTGLGEPGFRAVERAALLSLPVAKPVIVSTGGGTPCFFDNLAWMQRQGRTVFLDVPEELLIARLLAGRDRRPLWRDLPADEFAAAVAARLAQRRPWYERADVRLPFSGDETAFETALLEKLGHIR
jgi:shikimate kinase